jgi:RNA polymerase sigma-70 factor, ECF subfamily
MHDQTARMAASLVTVDQELEREFESRLVETSTLAFRVAYGVLRHKQDAEDVAQEAFVKAYRNFRALRNRERFRAWLVRMTWRLAIDRRRNDRRREARDRSAEAQRHTTPWPGAADRMPAAATSSSVHGSRVDRGGSAAAQGISPAILDDLEARERAGRLWAAIDALPEKLRIAIVLANIEEHDIGEVARLLDIPEGTVKSRLFLARRRLKELLQ